MIGASGQSGWQRLPDPHRRPVAQGPDPRMGHRAGRPRLGLRDPGRRAPRRRALARPLRVRPPQHPRPVTVTPRPASAVNSAIRSSRPASSRTRRRSRSAVSAVRSCSCRAAYRAWARSSRAASRARSAASNRSLAASNAPSAASLPPRPQRARPRLPPARAATRPGGVSPRGGPAPCTPQTIIAATRRQPERQRVGMYLLSGRWAGFGRRFAVVRVPAARPGAVQRPGREHAPLVDLVAQRASGREVGQVLLRRSLTHTPR
jgi:hypothetical protein